MRIQYVSKLGLLLALPALLILATACDTLVGDDDDDDHDDIHPELAQLELIDQGDAQQPVIATWTEDDGWDVDELVVDDHLHGSDRASIGLNAFNDEGHELELEEDGELFMTYVVPDDAPQEVIDTDLDDETLFHGDHVYIYPQSEGETEAEFLLWHADHIEEGTTALTLVVSEVPEE